MEQQIKDLTLSVASYDDKKHRLETDLKEHIDKIFQLRDVIRTLEQQLDASADAERTLRQRLHEAEALARSQSEAAESLHDEVASLRHECGSAHAERIAALEEQLRCVRPSGEEQAQRAQMAAQLRAVEAQLQRKTRALEALHSDATSAAASSASEDVSKGRGGVESAAESPAVTPRMEASGEMAAIDVQRIVEGLVKHTRAEEAAVKRIRDMEMQMATLRTAHDVSGRGQGKSVGWLSVCVCMFSKISHFQRSLLVRARQMNERRAVAFVPSV